MDQQVHYNAPAKPGTAPEAPHAPGAAPGGYPPAPGQGYLQPGYPPPQQGQVPQQGYGAPPQAYGAAPQPYGAPPQGYNVAPQGYGATAPQGYGAPAQGYGAPPQQAGRGLGWMPIPTGVPNCPPGLEYLTQIDQILVHQQVELLEALTGFETANKYEIKNSVGQRVYFAAEESDCCTRQFCGPCRNFEMKIVDNNQREVIHLERPLRCSSCWTPCFLQELTITSPPGTVIGKIEQQWHIFLPKFDIKNEHGDTVLKIEGPCIVCKPCGDVEFKVMSKDDVEIGKISKQWSGLIKEAFTDTDNFGVKFPMDLDVKMKACLLAAVFLIDFMFFEETGNQNNQSMGVWD